MRTTLVLLCLTAGCGLAPRSAPLPASGVAMVGCYDLEYGAWGPEMAGSRLDSPARLPTTIHLSAKPSGWREGRRGTSLGYEVRVLSGASPQSPLQVWNPLGGDSVWVGHPIGLGGFDLHLVRDGADLHGEVEAYTDHLGGPGPSEMRTSATARRIPCPAS